MSQDIDHYIESTSEKRTEQRAPSNSFEWPSRDGIRQSQMVDKQNLQKKMVDKWSIKPSLAEKLVDILEYVADKEEFTTEQIVSHFEINATTAKRYLRQLSEFGYLEPRGGNKNRTYSRNFIDLL